MKIERIMVEIVDFERNFKDNKPFKSIYELQSELDRLVDLYNHYLNYYGLSSKTQIIADHVYLLANKLKKQS